MERGKEIRRKEIPGRGTRRNSARSKWRQRSSLWIQKHREKGEDGCRRILGEILDFCFPLPLPQPLDQRPHDPKALICQPVSGSITVTGRGRREKQKEQNTE